MMETLGLGEAVRAGDWTLIPVIRKSSFCTDISCISSVVPVGIIGMQENNAHFFPFLDGYSWKDVEKELPGISGERQE
ncbi:MAG: hypothetical protein ABFC24_05145 [Methanoregulaceae archaeon]